MRELRILIFPLWLVGVILRNQLWLKPRAYYVRWFIARYLRAQRFPFKSINLSLGLAKADILSCVIITWNDAELAKLQTADCLPTLIRIFQSQLRRARYPRWAIAKVRVSIHSEESIERAGGYFRYFN